MNWQQQLHTRRSFLLAVLTVVVAAAVSGVVAQSRRGVAGQETEPWPPFTMVWRETARGLGFNGAMGTQVLRLEYTDRHHFKVTLLENPQLPEVAGSTWVFDGSASSVTDARIGKPVVTSFQAGERTVPSEWLVPGKVPYLLMQGGHVVTPAGDGLAVLVQEESLPDGKRVREELTYRLAEAIPMRQVITVDGVEVSRREVIDFKLGIP
jgi:hypothetical protein